MQILLGQPSVNKIDGSVYIISMSGLASENLTCAQAPSQPAQEQPKLTFPRQKRATSTCRQQSRVTSDV